jgi:hypothetical protein
LLKEKKSLPKPESKKPNKTDSKRKVKKKKKKQPKSGSNENSPTGSISRKAEGDEEDFTDAVD